TLTAPSTTVIPLNGRLVLPVSNPKAYTRAVWTGDQTSPKQPEPPDDNTDPFQTPSLTRRDRWDIVQNTSVSRQATITGEPPYISSPVLWDRFSMSALGVWADGRGAWQNLIVDDLIEWKQKGTFGRDNYVRIVRQGYL